MATESRAADLDVVSACIRGDLEEHVGEFEFFQAVRLLHLIFPENTNVRFYANPALDFPPSQIDALDICDHGTAHMTVNFLGLVGPIGALPYFYSELVNDRVRAKDPTLRAFLDIFHHRLIFLFYQAWEKHRFPALWEQGVADGVSTALRALLGIGGPGLCERQHVADRVLMFYAGLLAIHSRPAAALEQLLEDYFEIPVAVEQFAGAWYMLPEAQQCRLGSETCFEELGVGSTVGDAILSRQSRVRIHLGPMRLARYREFLPSGRAWREAEALIEFFANREFDFELQLALERGDVPEFELGGELPLGWCSWLKTEEFGHDPDDAILQVGRQLCM